MRLRSKTSAACGARRRLAGRAAPTSSPATAAPFGWGGVAWPQVAAGKQLNMPPRLSLSVMLSGCPLLNFVMCGHAWNRVLSAPPLTWRAQRTHRTCRACWRPPTPAAPCVRWPPRSRARLLVRQQRNDHAQQAEQRRQTAAARTGLVAGVRCAQLPTPASKSARSAPKQPTHLAPQTARRRCRCRRTPSLPPLAAPPPPPAAAEGQGEGERGGKARCQLAMQGMPAAARASVGKQQQRGC